MTRCPSPKARSLPAARALRNVWLWLANVGKVCNQELGTPYHRCLRLFDEAKDNCERAVPFLFFLCYVIVTFKSFCGLANGAWVPAPLQRGRGAAGQTPAHRGGPTLAETPPLHSCPPLLRHSAVHPVLPQE